MRQIILISCLILTTYGAPKDKKISLDDIERDLLANERPPPPVQVPKIPQPAPSPTKFGFIPTRTASSYAQQSPKSIYTQTQYVVQNLQQNPKPHIKYVSPTTESPKYQVQYSPPQQDFTYYQPQYQHYENVQYVTDNSINTQQEPQQYYQPQYVYVQQYQAPSTAVQTVVDPKGVQYVMYVPAYQNSVVDDSYAKSYGGSSGSTDVDAPQQNVEYVQVPQKYTTVVQKENTYVPRYEQPISTKSQYSKGSSSEYVFKREPKSLLDSYVPSILQVKYLQELQRGLHNKRNS